MLDTIFATKGAMSQAWTKQGKRLPITKCKVDDNVILGTQKCFVKEWQNSTFKNQLSLILEIGYGKKKLKNTPKPLRTIIEQSGFSFGFKQIKGVRIMLDGQGEEKNEDAEEPSFKPGQIIAVDQVLAVGDVVKVQGTSKGRGFAGVVKRHGMAGGPKTRGQSDRQRAVGSIGAGTTPGRVYKGKRMPGHFGNEAKTVMNLTVVYIDPEMNEVWLSGPVPGYNSSIIKITKTGANKDIELDSVASGIKQSEVEETKVEEDKEVEASAKKVEKDEKTQKEEKKEESQQSKDKKQDLKTKKNET